MHMLNNFLIAPIILLAIVGCIGHVSLLVAFQKDLNGKFQYTIWHDLQKIIVAPEWDSLGYIHGLSVAAYILVTLPVLMVCGLSGYFYRRTKDTFIRVLGGTVGFISLMCCLSIMLWLRESI